MMEDISKLALLQRKLKKENGILEVYTDKLSGVTGVQMYTLDDFFKVATQLDGVAEIKSLLGRIERLEYNRDGMSFFTLLTEKEERKEWENIKNKRSNE